MTSQNSIALKVCGMRDPKNMIDVAALNPDYMGFIFYPHSKRTVPENFEIGKDFSPTIKRVGVFVNETPAAILGYVRKNRLDFAQLHGEESPADCEALRSNGVGVIKVFHVSDEVDFSTLGPFKGLANYFLFDTKGAMYGGSGTIFNWEVLRRYDQEVPFFLSGGLRPENISKVEAIADLNIHALDVNSGVELQPGLKDIEKIKRIQSSLLEIKRRRPMTRA